MDLYAGASRKSSHISPLFLRMLMMRRSLARNPSDDLVENELKMEQAHLMGMKTHKTVRDLFGKKKKDLPKLTILPLQVSDTNDATLRKNRPELSPLLPKPPFVWLMPTQRESGKTTIIINLFTRDDFYHRWFDEVYLWCSTLHHDDKWKAAGTYPYITKSYDVFDEEQIRTVVERQKTLCRENKRTAPNICLIFDDEIWGGYLWFAQPITPLQKLFAYIATAGRHEKISLLVTAQCFYRLAPTFRDNATDVTVLAISNGDDLFKLYESYGSLLNKKQFLTLYKEAMKAKEGDEHSFWYIACREVRDLSKRFRRNFDQFQTIPDEHGKVVAGDFEKAVEESHSSSSKDSTKDVTTTTASTSASGESSGSKSR